ncbi:MAG: penicillin acylase family protein [Rhodobacteraceae bacterium]|nr:penicillin acylase family protein [Paracoccaceae bacterium]
MARDRDPRRDHPRALAGPAGARHHPPHLPRAGHLWRPRRGGAITLASPQLSGGEHSFDCLPRMLRAGTVAEFCEATPGWSLIDRNLVAADRDGHIGHRVRAPQSCRTLPRGPSRASLTGSDKIHGGRSERPAPGDGIWCWSGHLSLAPVRRRARAAENGSDVASKLGDFGARIARRERSREVRASPAGGE